jgi:RNA polymerase sigma factor (sigma-70 family)
MQKYNQFSEQELIVAFMGGSDAAVNELVGRTKDRVFTTAYLLVKDKYLAEDMVQDAYVKAIKKIRAGLYANDGKFCAWVCRIVRNLCMDYFRSSSRTTKVTLSNGRDIFDYLELEDANVQDGIMQKQSGTRVKKLLELLPQEQRDVIVMRLFADMSFKDIAEETNSTLNTCLGRMRYGLLNLRKLVQEKQLVL